MSSTNFSFLEEKWSILAQLGEMAERNVYIDPHTSLMKLRLFGETITKYIFAMEEMVDSRELNQHDRLNQLKQQELLPQEVLEILHTIRMTGNRASHEAGYGTTDDAKTQLRLAFKLSLWFMEVYGDWSFQPPAYQEPIQEQEQAVTQQLEQLTRAYEDKVQQLEQELQHLLEKQQQAAPETKKERKSRAKNSVSLIELNESETRVIIDTRLREAGWEVDSQKLRFSEGTRPEKGRNLAIAEWKLQRGVADYALFIGLDFVGIIEAKRYGKPISADIGQAKDYARQVVVHGGEQLIGPYGDYQIPFLFSTNGREYIEQYKEQSGIWFLDARKSTNHARCIFDWYTPDGLKQLLKQDIEKAEQGLEQDSLHYLNLRDYQENAILSVESAISSGQRAILVAMATGTGKTRTAIGLIYRLIKHRRFNRILFLVDRSALGEQAEGAFKDSKLENMRTFTEIFELQSMQDKEVNPETKVHIATVQSMVKRLFFNEQQEDKPSIDQYDCIIVDEAHRGYTLDKSMSDLEFQFRDHNDYVSKYRKVLDYFDAVRIGLTATPALHTTEIFNRPVFTYSYREAVIDGHLIDHEPPVQFNTELKQNGINWRVGEEVAVYDTSTGQMDKEVLEDEVNIEVTQFNKMVITENFNRVILAELTKHIDPSSEGKTLIFAATDDHADMIVRIFKEELEKQYGSVEDNAVMKITGSIKEPLQAIKLFKNERLPNIVVTVDLLTTGIDIPSISNIVFLRRVRSRILYEQMLGRATRKCDEIGKDHFMIYDAVGIYESLLPYTDMKPVVAKPSITVEELIEELEQISDSEQSQKHQEQIIAKIQRKKRNWNDTHKQQFKALSGGLDIDTFIDKIKELPPHQMSEQLATDKLLVLFIDENKQRAGRVFISTHEDKLIGTTRGYGEAEKPEDYLEGFEKFIKENMNLIPALSIICTRPSDLTRDELRKLKVALDQHGYSENYLQSAWRDAKQEDIAADIISFIRQKAIGDPLISHEERIQRAMKQIYEMKVWTKVQKDWLKRIEKQLLKETILDPSPEKAFDVEPFKSSGGYRQLNKIFEGELDSIVHRINFSLYTPPQKEQA